MHRSLSGIFVIIIVLIFAYLFWSPLQGFWTEIKLSLFPCRDPMLYSIGSIPVRFGISKNSFLQAVKDAEAIWEKPTGQNLFEYKTDGFLTISLSYDYRQDTTKTLQKLGVSVDQNRASYDLLKSKYESLARTFKNDKERFDSARVVFESHKNTYEAEVADANRRRKVSEAEYNRLNTDRENLQHEIDELNQLQRNINAQVDDINTLAATLNNLAKSLNLKVANYNEVGKTFGGEFEEGNYTQSGFDRSITIFQYDNYQKLVRVLAHEMGHALGLEHVDDSKAIMYRLNQGTNEKPTGADIAELKQVCGL